MNKKCFSFAILFMFFVINFSFSQERFSAELMWKLGRVNDLKLSPDGKTLIYGLTYYKLEENKGNRDIYSCSVDGGAPVNLTNSPGSELNAVWRPDGKKIGYIAVSGDSYQIWEMNPDGSGKTQISNINGGVNGFLYSPDMKRILYIADVKLDNTVQDIYPDLPKANARIIDDLMYRHWDSWHDYAYSHIFVAAYDNGTIVNPTDIMQNQKFDSPLDQNGGMEQITFSPDGNSISYTCKRLNGKEDAESTNSDIYVYNINTGSEENISSGIPGYDVDPVFSPDGNYLVWSSMKTAAFESDKKRIMLYDFKKKISKDLTSDFDQSSSNFCWSNDSRKIYFISGINATYQIYSVDISSDNIKKITDGWHDYKELEVSGNLIVGLKQSMSLPSEIFKIDENTGKEAQITFTNKELLSGVELAKIEQRWVKTTDNKNMLVWVIYPPGFSTDKKYPALLYCQGGPQSAVSQFFSYRWNFQMMAANDYIIVAPNRRGLPTFGQEWNDEISQDYGGQNMQDYFSAIDSISNLPFVDKSRLGAVGASYGGFSVYWLAGNHNKRFKCFIAHCGMFNFESWYGSTEEMWFANYDLGGAYYKNPKPESYEFSPHKFVGNWDTPILIIHGGYDFRIPYTQAMEAFNAAQLQGIPSRFLFFPEETHFVSKPQNSVLWQREFFKWLDAWLK
jgi:dipeptidyl aminopeptidase/acylaminoacyl peptidase